MAIVFASIAFASNAQRDWNQENIRGKNNNIEDRTFKILTDSVGKTISFKLDYSESMIKNIPFEDFVDLEENWELGYKEITAKFLAEANDELGGKLILSSKKETEWQIVLKLDRVDDDGGSFGSLYLYDKNGNVLAETSKIHGVGGKFGTQLNLMGDAAERMGKQVGRILFKQMK